MFQLEIKELIAQSKKKLELMKQSTGSSEGNFVKVSKGDSLEFKKALRGEFIAILKMRRVIVERMRAKTA